MHKLWNLVIGLVAGFAVAAVTAFSHSDRTIVSGHIIRYGFFLALVLIVLAQLWIGRFTRSRLTTLGFAIAWVVATIWFGSETADKDMALPQSNWSLAYVGLGSLLVTVVASIPVLKPKS